MIRLPARLVLAASAAIVLAAPLNAPVSAQQNPNTFTLPTATPTPTPAPAGPADERAGVAIPPRAAPTPRIAPVPVLTPEPQAPTAPRTAPASAPTSRPTPAPTRTTPTPAVPVPLATATAAPEPLPTASSDPIAQPTSIPETLPDIAPPVAAPPSETGTDTVYAFPGWELIAAGGLGAVVLLGAGVFLWRRRQPKVLRLAASPAATPQVVDAPRDLSDLHLALDITTATRSMMMFTLAYRLNIANRAGSAVNDLRVAVQLACARASGGVPSVGAAQALGEVARIGPHQARSIAGEVQLPLSSIQPLRQGTTPLFVPLVHVTIESDGQPAITKTFVIGSPSASGRVHPINLDQQAGGIIGLVAQAVAVPAASAAA